MAYFLAIDIGASSGRHIVGWKDETGELKTEEVFRFPNGNSEENGHLIWNIAALEANVRLGIDKAIERFGAIESLSIDTWGVDYVLLNGDEPILPCYAYRDNRTGESIQKVHELVPFTELYKRTGIQFQPFNTIYQLYADKMAKRLEKATDFLLMPEYLLWRLCGIKAHEYTNATTGGLVNAYTKEYDMDLVEALGLPQNLFKPLSQPGTKIGAYKGINVVLCATHDTGSAVAGIPMPDEALFLSSGTWSLLGAKVKEPNTGEASRKANFTNEGGVGYIRYLKNIMGLWITQNLKKELGVDFVPMAEMSRTSTYDKIFDANDPSLMAPENMQEAILALLGEKELDKADLFRSVFRSLAECYRKAIQEMESILGKTFDTLYIVGGGAKNTFLNEQTQLFTGKTTMALAIEATAFGNLLIQMEANR